MTAGPTPQPHAQSRWRRIGPSQAIAIAMLAGVGLGVGFPDGAGRGFRATDLQVLSSLFLRMISMTIVPLLFATLVVGIAGHGDDLKRMGRLAVRSLLYFEVVTTLALAVGLVAVNLVRPGLGVSLATGAAAGVSVAAPPPTFAAVLEHSVPRSVFEAAAGNESLPIVVFTIAFAIALSQASGAARAVMLAFCESLSEVMFRLVAMVMRWAPVGVGAAVAATVGRNGLGALARLGVLVLTLYGALLAFAALVLLPVALAWKVPIRRFWAATREPWLLAFSTASSECALPLAFRNMERLGVPRRIVSFVLPAGYTFNMDGTTLYLSLASVFVAQAAGIAMPLSRQLLMMLTLMLTSKGLAAVPRASLVILAGTLTQFGLPLEGVAVILGVDALMDMGRTSLNVVGNCLASVVMARWEGEFDVAPETAPYTARGAVAVAYRTELSS
ncbi:MAG: dicarboxylate/amino acid:cation symporter [Gemmatimonadales bacterium]